MSRGYRSLIGAASTCCVRCGHTLMEHTGMPAAGNCGDFAHPSTIKRTVEDAKQSPLNPLRWSLSLNCGHDEWVTAKKKPTRSTIECGTCKMLVAEKKS